MENERREHQRLLIGALCAVLVVTLLIARDSLSRSSTALSSADPRLEQPRLVTISTPTPRPMPTPTPVPSLPPGYRMLASGLIAAWSPDGPTFTISPQPYRPTGERIGNRCRIALLPDPATGLPPMPWAACGAVEPDTQTLGNAP